MLTPEEKYELYENLIPYKEKLERQIKILGIKLQDANIEIEELQEKELDQTDKHNEAIEKLHKLFKKLNIEFKIHFSRYKEDDDYINIFHKGINIFTGTTKDLVKRKK